MFDEGTEINKLSYIEKDTKKIFSYISFDKNILHNLERFNETYNDNQSRSSLYQNNKNNVSLVDLTSETIFIDLKPYGTITFMIDTFDYPISSNTSLVYLKKRVYLNPGGYYYRNNDFDFLDVGLESGFMHEEALQDWCDLGPGDVRYEGDPIFADAFPVAEPANVTITSSIESGLEIGISESDGLSIGGSFVTSYSKSVSFKEPRITSTLADGNEKYYWDFYYSNSSDDDSDVIKKDPVIINTGYIFEIPYLDLGRYDCVIKLDYKFVAEENVARSGSANHLMINSITY